jgi:UDP-glucose 4-epimerase
MSNFLVTGGAGFIGSHIVERLVNSGYKVKVLDNFSSGSMENLSDFLDKIDLIKDDIRNLEILRASLKGVDCVLHHAALRSVPKSLNNPYEYNEVNINGTLNLLKASYELGVKRFVFASSSAIYGDSESFPEKEEDSPKLISPYALTKLTGEYYCRIFTEIYGLQTVSLRYFNVFGPRQALDDEYAVVIPKFIIHTLKDEPAPIYGTGKQSRDFIYIDNVVDANILAATKEDVESGVYNIGTGKSHTILELLRILNQIMHRSIKPVFEKPRPGDVFKTQADISKAKRFLGYRPKIDFIEGLKRTISWFQKERYA